MTSVHDIDRSAVLDQLAAHQSVDERRKHTDGLPERRKRA